MIHFNNVCKKYDAGFDALKLVSFKVPKESITFLSGHSGAGKSTLLKLITLGVKPTRGEVWVDGQNLNELNPRHIPYLRRKVGTVFQDHKLLYDRSVLENVALPLIVSGASESDIVPRVRAALDKVGLRDKINALPLTLSGGQQQRVGIARAVVSKPDILLADEPTGNLDADMSDDIMDLFYDFFHHGTTVIIATHDKRYLQNPEAGLIKLKDGQIIENHHAPLKS